MDLGSPGIYIACIAHDRMKEKLIAFVSRHRETFARFPLMATGTTGRLIHQRLGLKVTCMKSGPLGGDLQIGSKISCGRVRAVFFMRDPLNAHPHEPDIHAFARICDVHNVPVATNESTAELLLHGLQLMLLKQSPDVADSLQGS